MKSIVKMHLILASMFLMTLNCYALEVGDKLNANIKSQVVPEQETIYIVDFFAQWCISCRIELPLVNKLYDEIKQHGNVKIIGVDVDEELSVAKAFQASLGLKFPIINDTESRVIEAFEPVGMPALYYVQNGEIKGMRFGAIEHIDQVIRNDLQTLGVKL